MKGGRYNNTERQHTQWTEVRGHAFEALATTRMKNERIKWFKAMDVMLGDTQVDPNIHEGLRLARECELEDAKWILSVFRNGSPTTKEEAKRAFLTHDNDPRAMYFAAFVCYRAPRDEHVSFFRFALLQLSELQLETWMLGSLHLCSFKSPFKDDDGMSEQDKDLVQRSAQLGYAPAQVEMISWTKGCESFLWAEKAAAQGDRNGLYEMACCLLDGTGCEKNEDRALMLFREAASLDHCWAKWRYGKYAFRETDWERYRWWGLCAVQGIYVAKSEMTKAALKHLEGVDNGGSGRVIFEIGAVCKGHVIVGLLTVFGASFSEELVLAADRAVALHVEWCANAERTINCWIWIAQQKNVARDVRTLISKMLWANRAVWSQT
jgi:hypothetical protein